MQVNYKKVHPDALTPQFMTPGSAGFDLAGVDDLHYSRSPQLLNTGLVIATPRDHMLFITHRSSTPRRWKITVHNGIVDEDFSGDEDVLHLQVRWLDRDAYVPIPAGTRIAQGIFIPVTRASFFPVESMGESRGGWGSTG